jgi:peptidoglycan/LPS O-acetylase OafA/YrhL
MNTSMNKGLNSEIYIPALDGLRFLAILGVLFFHIINYIYQNHQNQELQTFVEHDVLPITKYGRFGVELFFIISGFTISLSIENYKIKGRIELLKTFYFRRLSRIFPPYFIIITCSLIFNLLFLKTLSIENGVSSYLASIFFIHNLIYPGEFPFLSGAAWSLEIEMQFYFLAPILFLLFNRQSNNFKILLNLLFFLLFFVVNNIGNIVETKSLLNYAHYFIIGNILAFSKVRRNYIGNHYNVFLITMVIIYIFIYILNINYINNGSLILLHKLFTLLILFAGLYYILSTTKIKILTNKIFTEIGKISYSIYLLNYPIIVLFGKYILSISIFKNDYFALILFIILFITLILFLSFIFYIKVEKPLKLLFLKSIKQS